MGMMSWQWDPPNPHDPLTPLARVNGWVVRQTVGGVLYATGPNGEDERFPVGFSVDAVVAEILAKHPTP